MSEQDTLAHLRDRFHRWIQLGEGRTIHRKIPKNSNGNGLSSLPSERASFEGYEQNVLAQAVKQKIPAWEHGWKSKAPRFCLARLAAGEGIREANNYIANEMKAHRGVGSHWPLHTGDFDFALMAIMPILFEAGDKLTDAAEKNLLDNVIDLPMDPEAFSTSVPRTLGLIRETENHILMTEGSRYLKALYINKHTHNRPRGPAHRLEEKLSSFLSDILEAGVWEFNSKPYETYTTAALMNLASYGQGAVSDTATAILDRMNWYYAIGSVDFKQLPPFRRKRSYISGRFHTDQGQAMKTWINRSSGKNRSVWSKQLLPIWAAILPYSPPKKALKWAHRNPGRYEARIGRGVHASPEVYSGGKGWLLSAGGTSLGDPDLTIMARPTTLITTQTSTLNDAFHLYGPGDEMLGWNNTGVRNGVAVVPNGTVKTPPRQTHVDRRQGWDVYKEPITDTAQLTVLTKEINYAAGDKMAALVVSEHGTEHALEKVKQDVQLDVGGSQAEWPVPSRDMPKRFEEWPRLTFKRK